MILQDSEIRKLDLIEPFNVEQVQPASYDLRLGGTERDVIQPGESMLGYTLEEVSIPENLAGIVFGKSSIGRDFLNVHYAGFIDPGFKGQIVLEFTNNSKEPIRFDKYKTICQIVFFELKGKPDYAYSGHYQNQKGITKNWMND